MASSTLTYLLDPARHPGEADLLAGLKTNVPTNQVVPAHMISAEEYNQLARQVAAMAAAVPIAIVRVEYPAGTPTVPNVVACWSRRGDMTVADFDVTANFTGNVTITPAPFKLPAFLGFHQVALNAGGQGIVGPTGDVVDLSGVAVQVRTVAGGVAVDANFTVFIL